MNVGEYFERVQPWLFKPKDLFRTMLILAARGLGLMWARTPNASKAYYDRHAGIDVRSYNEGIQVLIDDKPISMSMAELRRVRMNDLINLLVKPLGVKSVLEIGCGELGNLIALNELQPDLKLAGIDISGDRIQAGRNLVGSDRLELRQASAVDLPFGDGQFDLVFSFCAIEQMPYQYKSAIDEMLRVAKVSVALFEPCFELGSLQQKKRMINLDYVIGIGRYCKSIERMSAVRFHGPTLMPWAEHAENRTALYQLQKSKLDVPSLRTGGSP